MTDPGLNALNGQNLCIIEVLMAGIFHTVTDTFVHEPAEAEFQTDSIISAEVSVRSDTMNQTIFLDHRLQMVIGHFREEIMDSRFLTHPCHAVHPPAGESITGIDKHRMLAHQLKEVLRPALITVEGTVFIVRDRLEAEILRRLNRAVVIPV